MTAIKNNNIKTKILLSPEHIIPLAILRMAFGFLMSFSMLRFLYNGWIEEAYINPSFHFTYQYFNWIQPFGITTMYLIVISSAIAALCIALGLFYRVATIYFFISFTYLELIEKSWYLNHYYLVSIVAFLFILVPAHQYFSLDVKLKKTLKQKYIPAWYCLIFKFQVSIVYFYGGIAKINADWLIKAQPMKIWLSAKTDLPIIGSLLEYEITPYLFSWAGLLYDLFIPFLLWNKKTRPLAISLVIIFHLLTHFLFNIGMFPWLMIFMSFIFISADEWATFFKRIKLHTLSIVSDKDEKFIEKKYAFAKAVLIPFFIFQFVFPLRHFILSDNVLWTENGFRFSWQVMIMEKTGYVAFTIKDPNSNKQWKEYPSQRLSSIQEAQMSFQPDMIWQYAQYLKKLYQEKGITQPQIFVKSYATYNGRSSQPYINEKIDLTSLSNMDAIYEHIIPLEEF